MKEIEIKILEIDQQGIRNKLLALGAEKTFEGEVHALVFDFPDQRLHNQGSFLRVRKIGDKTELCFKGKKEKSQFKVREEIETVTDAFGNTISIIENLGLKKIKESKKMRESYQLGKIRFELDTFENIPTLLEIEAPTETEVQKYVKKLGFNMSQTTNISGSEVEEYYRSKNEQENSAA